MKTRRLVMDIGNSSLKLGCFEGDILLNVDRLEAGYQDEAGFKHSLLQLLSPLLQDTSVLPLMACSVVPHVTQWVNEVFASNFPLLNPPHFISGLTPALPVDLANYPKNSIGADRVVGLCAAQLFYPQSTVILLDFGTATTIDALSKDGMFQGGVIVPGVFTMANVLHQNTAQLSASTLKNTQTVLGMTSQECLDYGLSIGYRGLVREVLTQMKQELSADDVKVIATGGAAQTVRPLFSEQVFNEVAPDLLLKGLNQLGMVLNVCP